MLNPSGVRVSMEEKVDNLNWRSQNLEDNEASNVASA